MLNKGIRIMAIYKDTKEELARHVRFTAMLGDKLVFKYGQMVNENKVITYIVTEITGAVLAEIENQKDTRIDIIRY